MANLVISFQARDLTASVPLSNNGWKEERLFRKGDLLARRETPIDKLTRVFYIMVFVYKLYLCSSLI